MVEEGGTDKKRKRNLAMLGRITRNLSAILPSQSHLGMSEGSVLSCRTSVDASSASMSLYLPCTLYSCLNSINFRQSILFNSVRTGGLYSLKS
jgi:hypothetical protein